MEHCQVEENAASGGPQGNNPQTWETNSGDLEMAKLSDMSWDSSGNWPGLSK